MEPNFSTPRNIWKLYRDGFVGSYCDEKDVAKLLGELKTPLFGAAAYDYLAVERANSPCHLNLF